MRFSVEEILRSELTRSEPSLQQVETRLLLTYQNLFAIEQYRVTNAEPDMLIEQLVTNPTFHAICSTRERQAYASALDYGWELSNWWERYVGFDIYSRVSNRYFTTDRQGHYIRLGGLDEGRARAIHSVIMTGLTIIEELPLVMPIYFDTARDAGVIGGGDLDAEAESIAVRKGLKASVILTRALVRHRARVAADRG